MEETWPVTTVVINFRTPALTECAVTSFRSFYPSIPLLIIDNGSRDRSLEVLDALQRQSAHNIDILVNRRNLHHGPAMNQALHHLHSPFVLFLDSDCVVRRGGFLELMLELGRAKPGNYAVGKRITMNRRGFDVADGLPGHPYIRPICMLVKRELYLQLPPFERHGAPCLLNMWAAADRGLALVHFPVEDYLTHEGRGTARRHGYRLGLKGKINHFFNRIGL
jgi:glycosyltransferase involved in cell wall biosynthesis